MADDRGNPREIQPIPSRPTDPQWLRMCRLTTGGCLPFGLVGCDTRHISDEQKFDIQRAFGEGGFLHTYSAHNSDMAGYRVSLAQCMAARVNPICNFHTGEPWCDRGHVQTARKIVDLRTNPVPALIWLPEEPSRPERSIDKLQGFTDLVRENDPYHRLCVCAAKTEMPSEMRRCAGFLDAIVAMAYTGHKGNSLNVVHNTNFPYKRGAQAVLTCLDGQVYDGGWVPSFQQSFLDAVLALIHGAVGLGYYCSGRATTDNIPLMETIMDVGSMLRGDIGRAAISDPPFPRFEVEHVGGVPAALEWRRILYPAIQWRSAGPYVFLANVSAEPVTIQIRQIDGGPMFGAGPKTIPALSAAILDTRTGAWLGLAQHNQPSSSPTLSPSTVEDSQ